MENFTITIRSKVGTHWPIIVELSGEKTPLPIRREGLLELDLEALSTQVTPRDYGTRLGQALFWDRIREAFLQARIKSEDRLSVQLVVEAPELRTLRWERLCAPLDEQWRFLLFDQRTPLTLALPSTADRPFPPLAQRTCGPCSSSPVPRASTATAWPLLMWPPQWPGSVLL